MNSFKDIAYQILKEIGKPLHSKEITKIALNHGLLKTAGKTPEATMNAQLVVDINSKGELSRFKKAGPSIFALNNKMIEIAEDTKSDRIIEELEIEEEKEVEGGYIGKAGEHAVLSELLFRGYNAALMSVDIGVDIMASKNNKTFNIQVKTRNISKKYDAFHFNLRIVSFERHNAGGTFYIFILRESGKLDYLILPLNEIEKSIEEEFINVVGKGKLYRITIKRRNQKVYLGRRENDVSYYINRWDIIK
jgi:Holliday junction resolvase